MHCWNCGNLIVSVEPRPPRPPQDGPTTGASVVNHVQSEIFCKRCGWIYEVTVIHIGQRERKDPAQEDTNG